mmetsp:Transcript_21207/g.38721  ORF Transcript_21207/g.38721 Transcript_21207/m.38721 type:complete len:184 (-) Transcript_21207:95-646(-)
MFQGRRLSKCLRVAICGLIVAACTNVLLLGESRSFSGVGVPRRGALLAGLSAAAAAGSPLGALAAVREGFTETPSGLQYKVVAEGKGDKPAKGEMVYADYTGWLDDFESDKKFDSSRDRRQPLGFPVGVGKVIKGWDEAILDMKPGERRLIVVPPKIGYGDRGIGPIPPGSTLYFDVELKGLR